MSLPTIQEIQSKAAELLRERGVPEAKRSVELLLCRALRCTRLDLYLRFDQPVQERELEIFRGFIRRKLKREPVQYILGDTEFFGLTFTVTPAVLIPRPETELLVEAVVAHLQSKPNARILELCTGSGCIAISLAHQLQDSSIVATDISAVALAIAEQNARMHSVDNRCRFVCHDLLHDEVVFGEKQFECMVANPPYATSEEVAEFDPELRDYEPMIALTDSGDGLSFYRRIASIAASLLVEDGFIALEIGYGKAAAVRELLTAYGFAVTITKDYSGIERVVVGKRQQQNM